RSTSARSSVLKCGRAARISRTVGSFISGPMFAHAGGACAVRGARLRTRAQIAARGRRYPWKRSRSGPRTRQRADTVEDGGHTMSRFPIEIEKYMSSVVVVIDPQQTL